MPVGDNEHPDTTRKDPKIVDPFWDEFFKIQKL
jgi:hypothetical protein